MLVLRCFRSLSGSAILLAFCWAASSLLSLYPVLLIPMLVQLCRRRAGELVYEREIARIGKNASSTDSKTVRQLGFLVDRVRSAKVSISSSETMPLLSK